MTITPEQVYWITRLDKIQLTVSILAMVAAIIPAMWLFVAAINEEWKRITEHGWSFIFACLVALAISFCAALIPSTKEMAAIILIPRIVNNQHVQAIPDKAAGLLEQKLDEWLKEKGGDTDGKKD